MTIVEKSMLSVVDKMTPEQQLIFYTALNGFADAYLAMEKFEKDMAIVTYRNMEKPTIYVKPKLRIVN